MSSSLRLLALLCVVVLASACSRPTSDTGCGKDTDCKGERICVSHECAAPPGADPASASVPATGSAVPSPTTVALTATVYLPPPIPATSASSRPGKPADTGRRGRLTDDTGF